MIKTHEISYPISAMSSNDFHRDFFDMVYDFCYQNQYTFITYAHPENATQKSRPYRKGRGRKLKVLIAKNFRHKPLVDIRELTPAHPGFVFSPFDNIHLRSKFSFFEVEAIIPIDEWNHDQRASGKVYYRDGYEGRDILKRLQQHLSRYNNEKNHHKTREIYSTHLDPAKNEGKNNLRSTDKKKFCQQVKEQVSQLQSVFDSGNSQKLKKIVLSKLRLIPPPKNFNFWGTFFKMIDEFPYSFVNLVSGPKVGTWLGASPEILVRRDSDKVFHTVSLAGTQWTPSSYLPKQGSISLHQVAWTQKEIEEQAVTSRFIIDCFKTIRLREYVEEGPATVRKGNLFHLQSIFSVDMKKFYGDSLPYEMISLLHPTPAVGGMPQSTAIKEIRRVEAHDRRYYAGFMGPVEIEGSIDIYVNLRCMESLKIGRRLYCALYSGVGVNRFSNPEKEWEESEAKMKWLVEALKPRSPALSNRKSNKNF